MNCALLGGNVANSLSPQIHACFGTYAYQALSVTEPQLTALLQQPGQYRGFNITMPYKTAAMAYCDQLSPLAQRIGAVNTLVWQKDGRLFGDNTDYPGLKLLLEQSGVTLSGAKVLILGAGGAAKTAAVLAEEEGAARIVCLSRHAPTHAAPQPGKAPYPQILPWEALPQLRDSQVILNATPVGMSPLPQNRPVDLAEFPQLTGVADLVYTPLETRLLRQGRELDLPGQGGLLMLVEQARAAAELFLGESLPQPLSLNVCQSLRQQMTNIVLIGMPGAGKTRIAGLLAKALHRPLLDTDQLLAQAHGLPAGELLQKLGRQQFRLLEQEQVQKAGRQMGKIIACGGGVIEQPANLAELQQNGRIYWLQRALPRLAQKGRPLSAGLPALQGLYQQRSPLYRDWAAKAINNNGPAAATAQAIQEDFHAYFSHQRP